MLRKGGLFWGMGKEEEHMMMCHGLQKSQNKYNARSESISTTWDFRGHQYKCVQGHIIQILCKQLKQEVLIKMFSWEVEALQNIPPR